MNGKRILKYLGLALCVGLCFLLTSCYIAPDDINTGDELNTGSGSLIFQTLAPTATVAVTPETVVIETQNIFGSTVAPAVNPAEAATPTPTTAGNGWNAWGTVTTTEPAQPEGTPEPSTIVFITQTPAIPDSAGDTKAPGTVQLITKAPATPSPTPPSLQVGFTGSDEVRALQKRLKALGYYDGSVDGDFGKGTESAVKAFQKANGLTADGKAGRQTLDRLNSGKAITKKQASATATPKKGTSGGSTKTAAPTKKATATPRPTATPNLEKEYYLQTGSSGPKVRTLQNRLIELGWLDGKANGEYDAATRAAVTAFQKKTKGLYDDGVAGPDTLKKLYSSSAAKASGPAASIGETLEYGMQSDAVKSLQKRLKELGYLSGTADGKFGTATEAAVIAFQQMNGLTVDGKAGNATLNRLYSSDAVKSSGGAVNNSDDNNRGGADTSGISSTGYVTQENGSSGPQVKKIQQKLKELGYYSGSVDGKYGESTEAAVMAFQLRNSLTVDGKAGPATQRALFGSGTSISYSALRKGEEGTAVRNLQYTLYELGYYDGAIDGKYGDTTSDAVRAFQIQNKLSPVDGVAGSATLAKLYSDSAISATSSNTVDYDSVRPGDKGEMVVEVQDCLIQMGYLDEITGVYDDATVAAVKKFQKENGINADGIAGDRTLVLLFGY